MVTVKRNSSRRCLHQCSVALLRSNKRAILQRREIGHRFVYTAGVPIFPLGLLCDCNLAGKDTDVLVWGRTGVAVFNRPTLKPLGPTWAYLHSGPAWRKGPRFTLGSYGAREVNVNHGS